MYILHACVNQCLTCILQAYDLDSIRMYVAPPMRMGAWLMACTLRQRIEYY